MELWISVHCDFAGLCRKVQVEKKTETKHEKKEKSKASHLTTLHKSTYVPT